MISDVEKLTGVNTFEILGRDRTKRTRLVRQLYWKLLYEKKGYGYSEIGRLNERNHSTIISGIKQANNLLETGDKLAVELWAKMKEIEA